MNVGATAMDLTAAGAVATAIVVIAAAAAPVPRRPPAGLRPEVEDMSRRRAGRWIVGRLDAIHRHRRIPTANAEEVAGWCEALARQVRSGASLRHAVETVDPVGPVLQRHLEPLRRRLTRGAPLLAATSSSADESGQGADLRLALDMIGVAAGLGGSPAAALDRTASTLRRRATDRAERRSQAAQARISAHVLTVVPLGLLILLVIADQGIRATVTTPIGAVCIAAGLVLNGLGWIWMRAVIGAPR